MGKVVFNIVETDYDVSKDEEKYQKFRKDYLENLSVGVCRLVVFSVSVIISCCLVLCLTDFFDD